MQRPGNVKGEREEGVGGEGGERGEGVGGEGGERGEGGGKGDEGALGGGRRRTREEGQEEKVIKIAGVVVGKDREALLRNQRSSGCGCQYPGEAPVSYTDTMQRYSTHTHTSLNSTSYSPPEHFFFISYSTFPPPPLRTRHSNKL